MELEPLDAWPPPMVPVVVMPPPPADGMATAPIERLDVSSRLASSRLALIFS
jgi:hypothetical protein